MKLNIRNKDEAERVIDQFGGNQQKIKADYGQTRNGRHAVEAFGLYFTTPKPHLVVEAL